MVQKIMNNVEIVKRYLKLENSNLESVGIEENIKELCVIRLCKEIGINFKYNYRNEYFRVFSNVVGEAVARFLGINVTLGHPFVRLVRYNGVNLVDKSVEILNNFELEEAFLELYNFLDDFKEVVPKFN